MSAKIIQFPKSPARSDEWYYFKTYYSLYLLTVSIWSASIFTFIYEFANFDYKVGAGLGIWLMGLLLLAEFTYLLGVKRNQRFRKYQQEKENRKLIQPIYWLTMRVGTYIIFFVTVALGAVATFVYAVMLDSRRHFN